MVSECKPDIRGQFGALANRVSGAPVLGLFADQPKRPGHRADRVEGASEKKRAALLESIGRPGLVTSDGASNSAEHITDPLYAINGNARPLCRDDAGALTASLLNDLQNDVMRPLNNASHGGQAAGSEPPIVSARTRTKPTQICRFEWERRDGKTGRARFSITFAAHECRCARQCKGAAAS